MKTKQSLTFGSWEALVFIIILSTVPFVLNGSAYTPQFPSNLATGISLNTQNFLLLNFYYYQFIITVATMVIFFLKVVVFDFAANLEQNIETSYLLMPVKRSYLLVPIILLGVVLPYAIASASVFYALYLIGFHFSMSNALYLALLDFLPLMLVSSVSLLIAMKTRSSVATLSTAIILFFILGIFLGLNPLITLKLHSPFPLLILGIFFPAGSAYDFFFNGAQPLPWQGLIDTPSKFMAAFPWLVACSVAINIALLVAVFWYWERKFQVAGE